MAKIPSQLLKGTLEGALLLIIARGETYGYAVQTTLAELGFGTVPEGTIYPLLLKMQKQGLIAAERHASKTGPDRKYYHLTAAGQTAIASFVPRWQQLAQAMARLVEAKDETSQ
ncbi:MAG: PadR family transcriptional regulator [Lactobacillus sp.]|jgi:PadR family transcriptional regulator PadR|nr:PadR family transcriptional regulator [Lactobacillus sp.]MCI2032572.1 PadR family transcriptional regulator [Lactobacillus sp.]